LGNPEILKGNKQKMRTNKNFQQIATSFELNMRAILFFTQHIGGLADDRDEEIFSEFVEELAKVAEVDSSEIRNNFVENLLKNSEVQSGEIINNSEELFVKVANKTIASLNKIEFREWASANIDKLLEFMSIIHRFGKTLPAQGYLLRKGALMTLVSSFEVLLSDLLTEFYISFPTALSSEKSIKLSDLRNFSNIQDAEDFLVDKEVDSLINDGITSVLEFLRKQKIDVDAVMVQIDNLIEIMQRRNLLVHNDGFVDNSYISKVKPNYIQKKGIQLNKQLQVTPQYLQDSIDQIRYIGSILIQLCWRKWKKDEHEPADRYLNELTYNTLVDNRYELTRLIALYASKLKMREQYEWPIIINHAIALREIGQNDKLRKLVLSLNVPQNIATYKMAIHILLNENDKAFELLPKAIDEATYGAERRRMKEWPLFRPIQEDSRFKGAFLDI
jgi:hypothetical protein